MNIDNGDGLLTCDIRFSDITLDDEQIQEATENILSQLRDTSFIENVDLRSVDSIPEGAKPFGAFLVGVLTAEIKMENLKSLLGFFQNVVVGDRAIEVEVESGSKKLRIRVANQSDFEPALKAAEDFMREISKDEKPIIPS
jgi:hypothetical protein